MLPSRSRRIPVDQQLAAAQRLQQLHRPPPPAAPGWVPDPLAEPLHAAVPGVPGQGWEPVPPVGRALGEPVPVRGPEPGEGGPPSAPRAAAPYGPEVAAAASAGGPAGFPRSEPAGGRHRAPASAPPSASAPAPAPAGPWRIDPGTAFLQAEPALPHRQPDPLPPFGLADRGLAFDAVPAPYDTAPATSAPPAPPLRLAPPGPTLPAAISSPVPELRDRLADLLPPWSRTAVVAPSWRAVLALGLVGLFAVLLTAGAMWRARPQVSAVGAVPAVSVSTPAGRPAAAGSAPPPSVGARAALVVAVAGKVRHPGVVRLAAGARVQDAVRAAGGVRPGASLGLLNLARPVVDGEQILVGVSGAAAGPTAPGPGPGSSGGSGGTGAAGTGGAPVDLNTATESDLEQLPGVGPVLAQRILDWRTAHGSFTSVDQLRQVSGIGDKKFADLRPQVRV